MNRQTHVFHCYLSVLSLLACLIFISLTSVAAIKLPKLISNNMILQRDHPIQIWGWAKPGENIKIKFNGHQRSIKANKAGNWHLLLPAMPTGGPYDMLIEGENIIHLKNILLGDVWFCSGQSNMELPISRVAPKYQQEIDTAHAPAIRQFKVPLSYNFKEVAVDVTSGEWKSVMPQEVLDFSAVGYFFAKQLQEKLKVPVGIIHCAVGGSPIEAWLSEETLQKYPDLLAKTQEYKDSLLVDSIKKTDKRKTEIWHATLDAKDEGLTEVPKWYESSYTFQKAKAIQIPGSWDARGSVWLKKEFTLPASVPTQEAMLHLGRIVDSDQAYINGVLVGSTGYQYPPRRYKIPPGLLRPGKNTLVVRVISQGKHGEFIPDKEYQLTTASDTISLKGDWSFQVGARTQAFPTDLVTFQYQPTGLSNAMAAPIFPYSIKGILWYQGESNIATYQRYSSLLTDLVKEWRKKWDDHDLPFLYVQLPNYNPKQQQPTESGWANLREAQRHSLNIAHTHMAIAIDLGEWNDIHPLDKKNVAKRLALLALKDVYHQKGIIASGPVLKSWEVKGNRVELRFDDQGAALDLRCENNLSGFTLAGTDGKFVWANTEIQGNMLILRAPSIERPTKVRYAWADNPIAGLYNTAGLPASPFEIDLSKKSESP
ncbi:sialate O-acetylesterase [Olivibacter domesticus]|uniref:Sialate O-acetylesterase n=1 Tax=Olivibacter domesticus TaxID=407022 RepID=A0A1H7MEG0_OLID1|nr:sialate O-acetylesterase [Olivibacter domesticus]SEL09481.1 sialate O-acetylesterase [Olivibacter domesticus]